MLQQHCLNEETLGNYLEGSLGTPMRSAVERHLVACDGCRSRLVYYMRILDEDVRDDEESVLAAAMASWKEQPGFAAKKRRFAFSGWKRMAIAASVVLAVMLGVFIETHRDDRLSSIMESVSSQERPFRARLHNQRYSDFDQTRDARVETDLERFADAADLLREEGNLYYAGVMSLYARDFDQAIALLLEAVVEDEQAPERHNDLGVAYLEKTAASPEEFAANRERAREQFQTALEHDPEYATAIYNLALWYEQGAYEAQEPGEQEFLFEEARTQQDRYLEMDPDSGWATEVRKARSELESRMGESPEA